MPLTPQQKEFILRKSGYDPAKYDVSEDGYIDEKPPAVIFASPSMSNEMPQPTLRPAGKAETFVKEAIHAAPAAAGGGLGAATGAALGSAIFPGVGTILGGIGGGLLGGFGTAAAQGAIENKVVPEYVQQREANLQANPWSGFAGRMAAMPVGGFAPNLPNVGRAVGDTVSRLSGATSKLNPAQVANIGNVGVGAGLGTGIAVGQQVASGKPLGESVLSMDTLEALLGGAVFNKPNAIGKRMGFTDVPGGMARANQADNTPQARELQRQMLERYVMEQAKQQQVQPQPVRRGISPIETLRSVASTTEPIVSENKAGAKISRIQGEQQMFPLLTAEQAAKQPVVPRESLQSPEYLASQQDLARSKYNEQIINELNRKRQEAQVAKAQLEHQNAVQELQQAMQVSAVKPGVLPKPIAETPLGKEIYPDYTGNQEADVAANLADRKGIEADDIQAQLERKNQAEDEALIAKLPPEIDTELARNVVKAGANNPLGEFGKAVFTEQAKARGIDVGTTKEKGSYALLAKSLQKMKAFIGKAEGADTRAHEVIGHVYNKMLELSPYASDKRIQRQMLDAAAKSPELANINNVRKAKGLPEWAPDEFVANQQGLDWLLRNAKNESSNRAWWEQWKAGMKSVFGKATPADLRRLVDYKWHNDAVFTEYFGKTLGEGSSAGASRVNQPASEGIPNDEGFNTKAGDDVWSNPQEDITVNDRLKQPLPEGIEAVKKLGYTYDGLQDFGAGIKFHAFTRRGDAASDPGAGATFYVPESQTSADNLVRAAQAKNEAFGVKMQPEGEAVPKRTRTKEEHVAAQKERNRIAKAQHAALRHTAGDVIPPEQVGTNMKGDLGELLNKTGRPVSDSNVSKRNLISLNKTTDNGGQLGDTIADANAAIPGEEAPSVVDSPEASLAPEKSGDISNVPDTDLPTRAVERQSAEPDTDTVIDIKAERAKPVLDQSQAQVYQALQDLKESLLLRRAESVEDFGEGSAEVKAVDQQLKRATDGIEVFSKMITEASGQVNLDTIRQAKRVNQPEGEALPASKRSLYNATGALGKGIEYIAAPEVEKLRAIAPKAAAAVTKFYELNRANRGAMEQQTVSDIKAARGPKSWKEWVTQNNPDYDAVVKWRDLKQDGLEPGFELSAEQKAISDAIDRSNTYTFAQRESRPGLEHKTGQTPHYLGQVMSRKAAKILAEKPSSVEAKKYYQDFLDYRTKVKKQSVEDAKKDWQEIRGQFVLQEDSNISARFGAVDKATGLGMPISMRESHLLDRIARYNRRYARRIAYHDAIETNAEAKTELFDRLTGVGSTKVGHNIIEDVFGIREHNEAFRNAISGIIRAMMLGPLTGAKDIVAGQALGLQHMSLDQVLPAKMAAFKNYGESMKKAMRTGVIRDNIGVLEMGDGSYSNVQAFLERSRDIINIVQGRNHMENASRILNYGEGRHLTLDALAALKNGKLTGTKRGFLDDFLPDWQKYKNGEVPDAAIDEAAAKFVESVQGTYDYRGLPSIAMKGTLAPFLSLARWNVEKFNNFTKYVVNPAMNGNIKPLLMATIGGLIGGAAVNELVEAVSGHRERTPRFKEIAESKEQVSLLAYKLAGLASMAGYAGMMGDVVKSALDRKFGNKPQTWNNPLIQGLDTAVEDLNFIGEAVSENGANMELLADSLNMFMTDYVQAWRIAAAQLSEERHEQLATTNKRRDLKIYEMGEGLPTASSEAKRPNPLIDQDAREFKRTQDVSEAAGLVPELIDKAVEKATINGVVNPEQLKRELSKLRRNSYQTVPSPRLSPVKFAGYTDWMNRTQGPEATSKRIEDYVTRNAINKAKTSMIPKI